MADNRVTVQITGLYSPQKAAAYLGVSKMTLWRWTRDGIITCVMLETRFYPENELKRVKALRGNPGRTPRDRLEKKR
ncbi:hypothetical protein ES703_27114 [subsurface metagenome]